MTPAEPQPPAPQQRAHAKFYLWAAIILLLSCALLTYWWMPRGPREPEYNGRTLTRWLVEAVKQSKDPSKRKECEAAIRQIGTNGIPTLLKLLHAPDEPWRTKVNDYGQKAGLTAPIVIDSWLARNLSVNGFFILGHQAQGALPDLMTAVRHCRTEDEKFSIIASIEAIAPTPEMVFPHLIKLAQTGGHAERMAVAYALSHHTPLPELAVPFLTDQLVDPDAPPRSLAARTLGKYSTHALSATPTLVKLLSDPIFNVREAATNALRRIDPAAAAAASIK